MNQFEITGYRKDHGPHELLARFTYIDGKVDFDRSVGDASFITMLEEEGVGRIGCNKVKPTSGEAFVTQCLDVYSAPGLHCSPIGKPAASASNDVVPDSGNPSSLYAEMLACRSIDEIDDLLGTHFCAPDSSERSSNPPPSGKSAA